MDKPIHQGDTHSYSSLISASRHNVASPTTVNSSQSEAIDEEHFISYVNGSLKDVDCIIIRSGNTSIMDRYNAFPTVLGSDRWKGSSVPCIPSSSLDYMVDPQYVPGSLILQVAVMVRRSRLESCQRFMPGLESGAVLHGQSSNQAASNVTATHKRAHRGDVQNNKLSSTYSRLSNIDDLKCNTNTLVAEKCVTECSSCQREPNNTDGAQKCGERYLDSVCVGGTERSTMECNNNIVTVHYNMKEMEDSKHLSHVLQFCHTDKRIQDTVGVLGNAQCSPVPETYMDYLLRLKAEELLDHVNNLKRCDNVGLLSKETATFDNCDSNSDESFTAPIPPCYTTASSSTRYKGIMGNIIPPQIRTDEFMFSIVVDGLLLSGVKGLLRSGVDTDKPMRRPQSSKDLVSRKNNLPIGVMSTFNSPKPSSDDEEGQIRLIKLHTILSSIHSSNRKYFLLPNPAYALVMYMLHTAILRLSDDVRAGQDYVTELMRLIMGAGYPSHHQVGVAVPTDKRKGISSSPPLWGFMAKVNDELVRLLMRDQQMKEIFRQLRIMAGNALDYTTESTRTSLSSYSRLLDSNRSMVACDISPDLLEGLGNVFMVGVTSTSQNPLSTHIDMSLSPLSSPDSVSHTLADVSKTRRSPISYTSMIYSAGTTMAETVGGSAPELNIRNNSYSSVWPQQQPTTTTGTYHPLLAVSTDTNPTSSDYLANHSLSLVNSPSGFPSISLSPPKSPFSWRRTHGVGHSTEPLRKPNIPLWWSKYRSSSSSISARTFVGPLITVRMAMDLLEDDDPYLLPKSSLGVIESLSSSLLPMPSNPLESPLPASHPQSYKKKMNLTRLTSSTTLKVTGNKNNINSSTSSIEPKISASDTIGSSDDYHCKLLSVLLGLSNEDIRRLFPFVHILTGSRGDSEVISLEHQLGKVRKELADGKRVVSSISHLNSSLMKFIVGDRGDGYLSDRRRYNRLSRFYFLLCCNRLFSSPFDSFSSLSASVLPTRTWADAAINIPYYAVQYIRRFAGAPKKVKGTRSDAGVSLPGDNETNRSSGGRPGTGIDHGRHKDVPDTAPKGNSSRVRPVRVYNVCKLGDLSTSNSVNVEAGDNHHCICEFTGFSLLHSYAGPQHSYSACQLHSRSVSAVSEGHDSDEDSPSRGDHTLPFQLPDTEDPLNDVYCTIILYRPSCSPNASKWSLDDIPQRSPGLYGHSFDTSCNITSEFQTLLEEYHEKCAKPYAGRYNNECMRTDCTDDKIGGVRNDPTTSQYAPKDSRNVRYIRCMQQTVMVPWATAKSEMEYTNIVSQQDNTMDMECFGDMTKVISVGGGILFIKTLKEADDGCSGIPPVADVLGGVFDTRPTAVHQDSHCRFSQEQIDLVGNIDAITIHPRRHPQVMANKAPVSRVGYIDIYTTIHQAVKRERAIAEYCALVGLTGEDINEHVKTVPRPQVSSTTIDSKDGEGSSTYNSISQVSSSTHNTTDEVRLLELERELFVWVPNDTSNSVTGHRIGAFKPEGEKPTGNKQVTKDSPLYASFYGGQGCDDGHIRLKPTPVMFPREILFWRVTAKELSEGLEELHNNSEGYTRHKSIYSAMKNHFDDDEELSTKNSSFVKSFLPYVANDEMGSSANLSDLQSSVGDSIDDNEVSPHDRPQNFIYIATGFADCSKHRHNTINNIDCHHDESYPLKGSLQYQHSSAYNYIAVPVDAIFPTSSFCIATYYSKAMMSAEAEFTKNNTHQYCNYSGGTTVHPRMSTFSPTPISVEGVPDICYRTATRYTRHRQCGVFVSVMAEKLIAVARLTRTMEECSVSHTPSPNSMVLGGLPHVIHSGPVDTYICLPCEAQGGTKSVVQELVDYYMPVQSMKGNNNSSSPLGYSSVTDPSATVMSSHVYDKERNIDGRANGVNATKTSSYTSAYNASSIRQHSSVTSGDVALMHSKHRVNPDFTGDDSVNAATSILSSYDIVLDAASIEVANKAGQQYIISFPQDLIKSKYRAALHHIQHAPTFFEMSSYLELLGMSKVCYGDCFEDLKHTNSSDVKRVIDTNVKASFDAQIKGPCALALEPSSVVGEAPLYSLMVGLSQPAVCGASVMRGERIGNNQEGNSIPSYLSYKHNNISIDKLPSCSSKSPRSFASLRSVYTGEALKAMSHHQCFIEDDIISVLRHYRCVMASRTSHQTEDREMTDGGPFSDTTDAPCFTTSASITPVTIANNVPRIVQHVALFAMPENFIAKKVYYSSRSAVLLIGSSTGDGLVTGEGTESWKALFSPHRRYLLSDEQVQHFTHGNTVLEHRRQRRQSTAGGKGSFTGGLSGIQERRVSFCDMTIPSNVANKSSSYNYQSHINITIIKDLLCKIEDFIVLCNNIGTRDYSAIHLIASRLGIRVTSGANDQLSTSNRFSNHTAVVGCTTPGAVSGSSITIGNATPISAEHKVPLRHQKPREGHRAYAMSREGHTSRVPVNIVSLIPDAQHISPEIAISDDKPIDVIPSAEGVQSQKHCNVSNNIHNILLERDSNTFEELPDSKFDKDSVYLDQIRYISFLENTLQRLRCHWARGWMSRSVELDSSSANAASVTTPFTTGAYFSAANGSGFLNVEVFSIFDRDIIRGKTMQGVGYPAIRPIVDEEGNIISDSKRPDMHANQSFPNGSKQQNFIKSFAFPSRRPNGIPPKQRFTDSHSNVNSKCGDSFYNYNHVPFPSSFVTDVLSSQTRVKNGNNNASFSYTSNNTAALTSLGDSAPNNKHYISDATNAFSANLTAHSHPSSDSSPFHDLNSPYLLDYCQITNIEPTTHQDVYLITTKCAAALVLISLKLHRETRIVVTKHVEYSNENSETEGKNSVEAAADTHCGQINNYCNYSRECINTHLDCSSEDGYVADQRLMDSHKGENNNGTIQPSTSPAIVPPSQEVSLYEVERRAIAFSPVISYSIRLLFQQYGHLPKRALECPTDNVVSSAYTAHNHRATGGIRDRRSDGDVILGERAESISEADGLYRRVSNITVGSPSLRPNAFPIPDHADPLSSTARPTLSVFKKFKKKISSIASMCTRAAFRSKDSEKVNIERAFMRSTRNSNLVPASQFTLLHLDHDCGLNITSSSRDAPLPFVLLTTASAPQFASNGQASVTFPYGHALSAESINTSLALPPSCISHITGDTPVNSCILVHSIFPPSALRGSESESCGVTPSFFPLGRPRRNVIPKVSNEYIPPNPGHISTNYNNDYNNNNVTEVTSSSKTKDIVYPGEKQLQNTDNRQPHHHRLWCCPVDLSKCFIFVYREEEHGARKSVSSSKSQSPRQPPRTSDIIPSLTNVVGEAQQPTKEANTDLINRMGATYVGGEGNESVSPLLKRHGPGSMCADGDPQRCYYIIVEPPRYIQLSSRAAILEEFYRRDREDPTDLIVCETRRVLEPSSSRNTNRAPSCVASEIGVRSSSSCPSIPTHEKADEMSNSINFFANCFLPHQSNIITHSGVTESKSSGEGRGDVSVTNPGALLEEKLNQFMSYINAHPSSRAKSVRHCDDHFFLHAHRPISSFFGYFSRGCMAEALFYYFRPRYHSVFDDGEENAINNQKSFSKADYDRDGAQPPTQTGESYLLQKLLEHHQDRLPSYVSVEEGLFMFTERCGVIAGPLVCSTRKCNRVISDDDEDWGCCRAAYGNTSSSIGDKSPSSLRFISITRDPWGYASHMCPDMAELSPRASYSPRSPHIVYIFGSRNRPFASDTVKTPFPDTSFTHADPDNLLLRHKLLPLLPPHPLVVSVAALPLSGVPLVALGAGSGAHRAERTCLGSRSADPSPSISTRSSLTRETVLSRHKSRFIQVVSMGGGLNGALSVVQYHNEGEAINNWEEDDEVMLYRNWRIHEAMMKQRSSGVTLGV